MAVTLRFRPVLFGPPTAPTTVFHLIETPDGRARFRDFEISWPLDVPLDVATSESLPDFYQSTREALTILPVQEVTGATPAEAHQRMTAALDALTIGPSEPVHRKTGRRRSA
jgi:hypothetical protein